MRRRRRKGVSRRKVGLGTALVVTTLLLLAVSGTAVTAGLTGTPEVAVGATATDFPDYVAGLPAYAGLTGSVTVTFPVTPTPRQVQARVQPATGPVRPFQPCTRNGPLATWTCPVPELSYLAAVAAASSSSPIPDLRGEMGARPGRLAPVDRALTARASAALAVALVLSACGDDAETTAADPPPSATSGPAATAPVTEAPAQRCTSAVLSVAAGEVQPFASTRRLLVSLTNQGTAPCTLLGFGGTALVDGQGTQLPTRFLRSQQEPRTVVLRRGESTVRELSWRVVPSTQADPAVDCVTGAGLLVTPPDEEPGELVVDQEVTACDGGTLEATPWGQTAD